MIHIFDVVQSGILSREFQSSLSAESFLFNELTFLDVNGVDEGVTGDEEFDEGVDGNCGVFVADVEEGTFLMGV